MTSQNIAENKRISWSCYEYRRHVTSTMADLLIDAIGSWYLELRLLRWVANKDLKRCRFGWSFGSCRVPLLFLYHLLSSEKEDGIVIEKWRNSRKLKILMTSWFMMLSIIILHQKHAVEFKLSADVNVCLSLCVSPVIDRCPVPGVSRLPPPTRISVMALGWNHWSCKTHQSLHYTSQPPNVWPSHLTN